jgi:phenylacetate-coenzyme A ligase PaaK-like adenylate-forming protein
MMVVKGVNVFVSSIDTIINRHLDVTNGIYVLQVSSKDPIDRVVLLIEVRDLAQAEHSFFAANLNREFRDQLSIRPEINLVAVGELPRTEGKFRKVQRILS